MAIETSSVALCSDLTMSKYKVNFRYLKVEVDVKLLISQSKFSGPRKFNLDISVV